MLTQKVEPPETGIPEFRNISISDITVENGTVGIYCIAYEEKPMRNVVWENVKIEAQKPGKLINASDWTMKNVVLSTPDGENMELQNCSEIELPTPQRHGK